MGGNFVEYHNLEGLRTLFPIDIAACDLAPNLDIEPGRELMAIIREGGKNRLDKLHWGLVPFWARDVSIGKKLINARAETIAEKPSFREAFKRRRCLIPADGFYEWQGSRGGKSPLFIALPDRKPFAFAGLWETWHGAPGAPARCYKSCTIITTRASQSFSAIHHRMPVILKPQVYHQWLDTTNQDMAELTELLQNRIIAELVSYPSPLPAGSSQDHEHPRPAIGQPRQMTFDWPKLNKPQ